MCDRDMCDREPETAKDVAAVLDKMRNPKRDLVSITDVCKSAAFVLTRIFKVATSKFAKIRPSWESRAKSPNASSR
jgi:hypothetical protein